MGTALVSDVCAQSLPPVQGYPELGWMHPYPMSLFPVLDTGSGEAGGPRHWVLHGELWQQKLLGTVPLPYDLIKGCSFQVSGG